MPASKPAWTKEDKQRLADLLKAGNRYEMDALMRTLKMGNLDISGVDLRRAGLRGLEVNLFSNFKGADLRKAELVSAQLEECYFDQANLDGADLSFASLTGSSMDGASLRYADLNGAILDCASFSGADLEGANLDGSFIEDVTGVDFGLNRAWVGVPTEHIRVVSPFSSARSIILHR